MPSASPTSAHGRARPSAAPQRRGRRSPAPASATISSAISSGGRSAVEGSGDREPAQPLPLVAGEPACRGDDRRRRLRQRQGRELLEAEHLAGGRRERSRPRGTRPRPTTPRSTIASTRASIRASSSSGEVEADEHRRTAQVVGPEACPRAGASDDPDVGQLERADDAAAVVRVDARGGGGVALGEERVRPLRAELVVERAPALALAGRGRRRQLERRRAPPGGRGRCRRRRAACGPLARISSIAACARRWYSPTETSRRAARSPTSRAG